MPLTLAPSLAQLADDQRRALLEQTHPRYDAAVDEWTTLLDAYEGSGGFLDGDYLWCYPNELPEDFAARQRQARYHNYARALINLYVRHVFAKGAQRTTTDPALEEWWQDVDGTGVEITTFLQRATRLALAMGHVGLLVDKTPDEPTGPAVADERGRPMLVLYPPQSVLDWRLARGNELDGIKLTEAAPAPGLLEPYDDQDADARRFLLWTRDEWARFTAKGELIGNEEHGLGLVPFVMLRPESSASYPFFGTPMGSGNLFRALYNRASEEDEVLRTQAFSLLSVEVPPDGDVEAARQQLGPDIGTTRAVIVKGTVNWKTPDQAVPAAIRANLSYLVQELYRLAHVRFQRESLDAESAEAIRLQHSELNEMLTGLANELVRVEQDVAKLYYAWTSATPEIAAAAYEKAQVVITYPREFFLRDLLTQVQEVAEALALQLGTTMTTHLKRKLVRTIDPDLDQETLDAIDVELEQVSERAEAEATDVRGLLQERSQARLTPLLGADVESAEGED